MFRLTQEQLEESSFYQMILEKGTEVGRVEGLEVGLVEGTRRAVRLVAGLRFPALAGVYCRRPKHDGQGLFYVRLEPLQAYYPIERG